VVLTIVFLEKAPECAAALRRFAGEGKAGEVQDGGSAVIPAKAGTQEHSRPTVSASDNRTYLDVLGSRPPPG
jgi:hypothetical protein